MNDVRDEVLKCLKKDDRSVMWLSRKTGIPYGRLYGSISRKFPMLQEDLDKINKVFGTNLKLIQHQLSLKDRINAA